MFQEDSSNTSLSQNGSVSEDNANEESFVRQRSRRVRKTTTRYTDFFADEDNSDSDEYEPESEDYQPAKKKRLINFASKLKHQSDQGQKIENEQPANKDVVVINEVDLLLDDNPDDPDFVQPEFVRISELTENIPEVNEEKTEESEKPKSDIPPLSYFVNLLKNNNARCNQNDVSKWLDGLGIEYIEKPKGNHPKNTGIDKYLSTFLIKASKEYNAKGVGSTSTNDSSKGTQEQTPVRVNNPQPVINKTYSNVNVTVHQMPKIQFSDVGENGPPTLSTFQATVNYREVVVSSKSLLKKWLDILSIRYVLDPDFVIETVQDEILTLKKIDILLDTSRYLENPSKNPPYYLVNVLRDIETKFLAIHKVPTLKFIHQYVLSLKFFKTSDPYSKDILQEWLRAMNIAHNPERPGPQDFSCPIPTLKYFSEKLAEYGSSYDNSILYIWLKYLRIDFKAADIKVDPKTELIPLDEELTCKLLEYNQEFKVKNITTHLTNIAKAFGRKGHIPTFSYLYEVIKNFNFFSEEIMKRKHGEIKEWLRFIGMEFSESKEALPSDLPKPNISIEDLAKNAEIPALEHFHEKLTLLHGNIGSMDTLGKWLTQMKVKFTSDKDYSNSPSIELPPKSITMSIWKIVNYYPLSDVEAIFRKMVLDYKQQNEDVPLDMFNKKLFALRGYNLSSHDLKQWLDFSQIPYKNSCLTKTKTTTNKKDLSLPSTKLMEVDRSLMIILCNWIPTLDYFYNSVIEDGAISCTKEQVQAWLDSIGLSYKLNEPDDISKEFKSDLTNDMEEKLKTINFKYRENLVLKWLRVLSDEFGKIGQKLTRNFILGILRQYNVLGWQGARQLHTWLKKQDIDYIEDEMSYEQNLVMSICEPHQFIDKKRLTNVPIAYYYTKLTDLFGNICSKDTLDRWLSQICKPEQLDSTEYDEMPLNPTIIFCLRTISQFYHLNDVVTLFQCIKSHFGSWKSLPSLEYLRELLEQITGYNISKENVKAWLEVEGIGYCVSKRPEDADLMCQIKVIFKEQIGECKKKKDPNLDFIPVEVSQNPVIRIYPIEIKQEVTEAAKEIAAELPEEDVTLVYVQEIENEEADDEFIEDLNRQMEENNTEDNIVSILETDIDMNSSKAEEPKSDPDFRGFKESEQAVETLSDFEIVDQPDYVSYNDIIGDDDTPDKIDNTMEFANLSGEEMLKKVKEHLLKVGSHFRKINETPHMEHYVQEIKKKFGKSYSTETFSKVIEVLGIPCHEISAKTTKIKTKKAAKKKTEKEGSDKLSDDDKQKLIPILIEVENNLKTKKRGASLNDFYKVVEAHFDNAYSKMTIKNLMQELQIKFKIK